MDFFKTGIAPVKPEETIEIIAFMEAADESKRHGGVPVSPASVLAKASPEAATKLRPMKPLVYWNQFHKLNFNTYVQHHAPAIS